MSLRFFRNWSFQYVFGPLHKKDGYAKELLTKYLPT